MRHALHNRPLGYDKASREGKLHKTHAESTREKTPAEFLEKAHERVKILHRISCEREKAQVEADKAKETYARYKKSVLAASTLAGAALGFSEIALRWVPNDNYPVITALVITAYIPIIVFTVWQDSRANKHHIVTAVDKKASEERERIARELDGLAEGVGKAVPESGFENAARLKIIRSAKAVSRDLRSNAPEARGEALDERLARLDSLACQWKLARASGIDPTILS